MFQPHYTVLDNELAYSARITMLCNIYSDYNANLMFSAFSFSSFVHYKIIKCWAKYNIAVTPKNYVSYFNTLNCFLMKLECWISVRVLLFYVWILLYIF